MPMYVKRWEEAKDVLDKMKPKFISQARNIRRQAGKIWKDWEAFAEYAFNKSHSTCYAWIAYQTAYLKPITLLNIWLRYCQIMSDIKQVSFFMEECSEWDLKY
jgi:DNA polymerase-3 subunit alpha